MKWLLLVISVILISAGVGLVSTYNSTNPIEIATVAKPAEPLNADKLWNLVQQWRTSQNLQTYIKSDQVCGYTAQRAPELRLDEADGAPHKRFKERFTGIGFVISENYFVNGVSEESILTGWLDSPHHKEALLADYKYSCISCYEHDCVQIFTNFK